MNEKPFRILSIDGGGLRGIIPIKILQEIEKRTGKNIIDCFDLIAGTSTGGLISCLLTLPDDKQRPKFSLNEIEKLYEKLRTKIFKKKIIGFSHWFFKTKYSNQPLTQLLSDILGKAQLNSCLKPIYIPSFDLFKYEPYIFKSVRAHPLHNKFDLKHNYYLTDICKATSAAPTYFSPHEIALGLENRKKLICVDGGVFLNNPGAGALVDVMLHKRIYEDMSGKKIDFNNIYMLSIGTGKYTAPNVYRKFQKHGTIMLVNNIINLMMDGNARAAEYATNTFINKISQNINPIDNGVRLLDDNYLRLNVNIKAKFKNMDNSSSEAFRTWKESTVSQILTNNTMINKLNDFLVKSEIR